MNRNNDNYLQHYGVLGMKWGIRRQRNKKTRYSSKARRAEDSAKEWDEMAKYAKQKGNVKKAQRYKENAAMDRVDAKKYASRARKIGNTDEKIANQLYKANSKETNKRIVQMDMGKTFAQTALLGSYGALYYNKMRAENYGVGASAVTGFLMNWGDNLVCKGISSGEYLVNVAERGRN